MESPHVLHRRSIAAALLTILTLTSTVLFAQQLTSANQSLEQIPTLVMGVPVSREIGASEVHSYRITLASGQYARLVIDQRGLDLVVRVVGPDGRQLKEVDSPNGNQGPELVSVVAEENGTYQVEIRPLKKDARGNYEVRFAELRVATVQDRSLVAAQTAYAAGEHARLQKRPREAIKKYEEALELYRATADSTGEIATLNIIAAGYNAIGEKQKSLDYYDQRLQLHERMGNRLEQANTLRTMGAVYNSADANSAPGIVERQKALEFFHRAVALYKEVNDPKREAYTLAEIGGIYNAIGERQTALECFNQALQIQRTVGDRRREAYTLAYLGGTYNALGEKQKALDYFSQAVPLFKASHDRFGEASILTQLGGVYFSLGESDKALENLDRALRLHKAVGNPNWEASTLTQIGAVYSSLGDGQKALDYLNQALPLQKALNNRGWEAHTLTYMGAVYSSLGDWTKAMECFNQALKLSRAALDRNGEANIHLNMAKAERNRNNLAIARQHIESALEIIESLRTTITSHDLRASYLASKRDYYEFYIDLLMRLQEEAPSKGYDAAALQASERARARSLLETLSEAAFDIREGVDSQLLRREHELQKQINNKDMQRLLLLSSKPDEGQTEKIEKELNALLTDYTEVRAQIRVRSPRYAALMQPEPLSLREIQEQILDEETLLLEYALGDEKSYLWAVTQTDLMSFVLPKRAVVESAARRVYELLTSSHKIEARRASELAASELSRMVLGPARAALLKKKRLLIVSEGALQYVPFAALSVPEEQQSTRSYEPLITRYEVINLPSASVVAVVRRETSGRQVAPKAIAVLADAVFQNDDTRLQQVQAEAKPSTTNPDAQRSNQNDLMRSATESGITRFQRLPFTRQEAEAIVSQAGESNSLKALDFDASRDTVFNGKLDQYRIVHFATHGLLNSRHPELSGIVLSLVDKKGHARDGFLRTHDIYNLKLRANLVVLSACRTALGNEVKGEGLLSLTRGFMYSGAPQVVASVWDVKDEATAKLMKHFYQKILRDGLRPAAALRAAQLLLLKEPRWEAPYYWAGFTLQGDWR
jgi:CHAT domain-containing protein/tetratricopeptide (TPR) repeat protein